jgi:hypothetical protein
MSSSIAVAQETPPPAPAVRVARTRPVPLWARGIMTSLVGLVAWVPCEVLGGLIFLGLGIRLWTYHITPVFWGMTSLVAWGFVLLVLGTNCAAYLLWEEWAGIRGPRRWGYRALFLAVSGPVNEVVWNSLVWWAYGTPLYLYIVLPSFAGSGSLLSPLYYLTLLAGFWLDERVPGTLAYGRHLRRYPSKRCA